MSKFCGYFLLLIGLGYQTQRLYRKLKVEPEIFSKESSIQSSQIPFPAVTFCMPFSVKNETWNPEFLKLSNLTENDLRNAMLQTCTGDHDMYMKYKDNNGNVVDTLLKTSANFEEIFNVCGINKYWLYHQDCEKIFVRSVTEYGICFTFNMIGHGSLFNSATSPDFNAFKRTNIVKIWDRNFSDYVQNEAVHGDDAGPSSWNLETGYANDYEHIQPARALRMQTLLISTVHSVNESFCEGREGSYKVMLHLPNELPQTSYDTIDIPFLVDERILLSADVTYHEDSLRSFPPETRGCYFEGEKPLKVFKSYTKANCEYECMAEFVNATCGCVKFSMPRTKDMKVCDFFQFSCIHKITNIFPRSYYEDHENRKKFPDYPCGCLPSCLEIKYKVIKSEIKNMEKVYITNSTMHSSIEVIFADSQIKKTSNYVTYEIENFVFDIGGLIGLFLGSSLLSLLTCLVGAVRKIRKSVDAIRNVVNVWKNNETDEATDEQQQSERIQSAETEIESISSESIEIEDLNVTNLEN